VAAAKTDLRPRALLAGLLLLAAGCAGRVADPSPPAGAAISVWVVDHGWHTAIVLRRDQVARALWPEVDEFPSAVLIEVAWGDREFYMATPATAWMAVKAALASRGSVLHVAGLDVPPAVAFPGTENVERRVPPEGFEALVRFIAAEHERDLGGRALRLGPGLDARSVFYAARSRYSLANTCNTWVARALQEAGLPVSPSGVITPSAVMRQLRPVPRAHP
jgi:uncharacterized protein (TIGR02117 family)